MEEQKLDSEGGKRRGSQTIEGEEHWVVYDQCCVELCKIALICVHKEEKASAESTERKDPELGVIWGNHPKADEQAKEAFKSLVREKKSSAFSYSVADLGTYTGEVGDFKIELMHSQPIMAKRRKRSPLEQHIQDE